MDAPALVSHRSGEAARYSLMTKNFSSLIRSSGKRARAQIAFEFSIICGCPQA